MSPRTEPVPAMNPKTEGEASSKGTSLAIGTSSFRDEA